MGDSLEHYCTNIQKLRNRAKEWKINEEEIDKLIDDSFKFLESDSNLHIKRKWYTHRSIKSCTIAIIFVILGIICLHSAEYYFLRNIQEIYPIMKLLRKLMLPVVKLFPSITEWYDEACLVSNPYFKVPDIDCWPCENVRSILNLTLSNLANDEYHSGIPFLVKDSGVKKVNFKMLSNVYHSKNEMFDKDASKIEHSNGKLVTPYELFKFTSFHEPQANQDLHITWKLNRLEPTREIRSLFGIPRRIPNFVAGATLEKYILIDGLKSPHYYLPSTEGTTVFIVQGCGARLYVLEPSKECSESCHRVSILLKPNHVLWYNWWYWRAISIPVSHSTGLSITYVGSYY